MPPPAFTTPRRPQVQNTRLLAILAAAVVAVIAIAAFTFALTRDSGDTREAGANSQSADPAPPDDDIASENRPAPHWPPAPAAAPRPDASRVALNVSVPISQPACDGSGIVVLRSAVTPGNYQGEIQRYLNEFPGASYLRTDHSCPSLRQATDQGNPIYAVYRPAGHSQAEICSAVRRAGGDAYGKWLDATTDPSYMLPC
nr:serine/threonine protein kinase [Mycobacterium sp.]